MDGPRVSRRISDRIRSPATQVLTYIGMQLAEALGLSVAAGLMGVEELADCLDRTSITTGPHARARDQRVWRVLQYFFQRTRKREHLFLPHAWPPGNAC